MGQFYILEPEVAGNWIMHSEADRSVDPPEVTRFCYTFDGWMGDDLLEHCDIRPLSR